MLVIVKGLSKTLAERRSRGSIPIAHILWKDHNTENNHYSRIPRPLPTQRVMIPFPVSPFLVYSALFCFIFYLSCSLYPFHTVIWLSPKISVMHFPNKVLLCSRIFKCFFLLCFVLVCFGVCFIFFQGWASPYTYFLRFLQTDYTSYYNKVSEWTLDEFWW